MVPRVCVFPFYILLSCGGMRVFSAPKNHPLLHKEKINNTHRKCVCLFIHRDFKKKDKKEQYIRKSGFLIVSFCVITTRVSQRHGRHVSGM
jgi:hypothetical protein